MTNLRQSGDSKDEAQRFEADQAAREAAELDVLSVWYVVEAKLAAGLVEEAKAIVAQWKEGKL